MSSRVELYINLPGLAGSMAENVTAAIAGRVVRLARQKVRVSTDITKPPIRGIKQKHGVLRDTIHSIRKAPGKLEVVAETEYAWAQERGLAKFGKPNYGYTPYMEPSAEEVTNPTVFKPIVDDAIKGAIEKQRRRAVRK